MVSLVASRCHLATGLFCSHEYLLDAVELNRAHFSTDRDQGVIPVDVDGPDSSLLAGLNDINGRAALQIEDDQCTFVISSDQV